MANPSPSTEVFPQIDARLDIDGSTWNLNSITNESVALVAITAASSTAYKIGYLAERPAELNFASSNAAPAISGFTLVTTVAAVNSATKFYVDYDRAFIITASSVSGPVSVTYSGMGSTVRSREINNIHYGHNYLGPKSSAPTEDNEGNALAAGDQYYDTSANTLYLYSGSAWIDMAVAADGNTITSADGYDLTLTTNANGENVVINSGSASIKMPKVRATVDNYVLAMSDKSTGETEWQAAEVAPTLTSFTGTLNAYEAPYSTTGNTQGGADIRKISNICTQKIGNVAGANLAVGQYISGTNIPADTTITALTTPSSDNTSNGVITISADAEAVASGTTFTIQKTPGEKAGGTLVLTGTEFGVDTSKISVLFYAASSGGTGIAATYIRSLSGTGVTAEWTGSELNYSGHSGHYHVEVKKGTLASERVSSGANMTGDPTISNFTVSDATISSVAVGGQKATLGTYGGYTEGGGKDSNTKLLLNFDRNGGTDFEDNSNIGGDGHKVTASGGALIKASPFGDGKSGMYLDGSGDKLEIPASADFNFGASSFTIEFWFNHDEGTGASADGDLWWQGATSRILLENQKLKGIFTGTSGGNDYFSDVVIAPNRWYHLAIVRDGAGAIKAYLDGVLFGTLTVDSTGGNSTVGNSTDVLKFGATDYDYKGYIDEVRVVKGTAVYTGDFTVPTSRLTAITNTKLLVHSNRAGGILSANSGAGSSTPTTRSMVDEIDIPATDLVANPSYFIDGNWTGNYTYFESGEAGESIIFDFKSATVVTGIQFYATGNTTYANGWTISGSNDSSSFSDGNLLPSFTLTPQMKVTWTNTTAYQYYRLKSSSTNTAFGSTNIRGVEFLNENTADNSGHQKYWASDKFIDSSDSAHDITPTGAYHSQSHKGIAPAMTWPANGKATGSAGCYFDGDGDYLGGTLNAGVGTSNFTIDFWMYSSLTQNTGSTHVSLFDNRNDSSSATDGLYMLFEKANNQMQATGISASSNTVVTRGVWHHIAYIKTGTGSTDTHFYIDGVKKASGQANGNYTIANLKIGTFTASTFEFTGYIDGFRITHSDESASGKSLYHASADTITVPSVIYGAYGADTVDIGTITLAGSATPTADVAFTEMGSSLPAGLSLSDSGSHGATITGTLTAPTSDVTTNNIRIQAKAGADDTRVTEIAESNQVGNLTLTHKGTEKPILFNGRRYIGNALPRSLTGFGIKPDMVWFKERDGTNYHQLFDSVRGGTRVIYPNSGSHAETDRTNVDAGVVRTFDANGITIPDDTAGNDGINVNNKEMILWAWKAGGVPSANNKSANGTASEDSIATTLNTSTDSFNGNTSSSESLAYVKRSVNTAGGFSIVEYKVRASANDTTAIPHGLGGIPDLVMIKPVSSVGDWDVRHSHLTSNSTLNNKNLVLNSDTGEAAVAAGTTAATAYHVYTHDNSAHDQNVGNTVCMMYSWKSVTGVSKFGSYAGNAGTQTITCGFKPRMVLIKTLSASQHWVIFDSFRGEVNGERLYANLENAEPGDGASNNSPVFGSTGFTFNSNSNVYMNATSNTYVYAAFA